MSDKNLAKARGLNSIADPSSFRGTSARRKPKEPKPEVTEAPKDDSPKAKSTEELEKKFFGSGVDSKRSVALPAPKKVEERRSKDESENVIDLTADSAKPKEVPPREVAKPKRPAVQAVEDSERIQREMSIPIPVHDSLTKTGYNVTDLLRRAYRNYAEEVRAGEYLRGMHRGRRRIRLSMSPDDYAKLEKLGRGRGWNRSEVVTVLLEAELANDEYKKS